MKTYLKPVIMMGGGGAGDLYPPGSEGSVGGGDGGEWGTGGDANRGVLTTQSVNVFSDAAPASVEEYVPSEFSPPIDEVQG